MLDRNIKFIYTYSFSEYTTEHIEYTEYTISFRFFYITPISFALDTNAHVYIFKVLGIKHGLRGPKVCT